MGIKRVHVLVSGRVQGVFFRACTQNEARNLCLCGWVRNRPEGTVEAEIQGESHDVDRMILWLHQGSPHSVVKEVIVTPREPNDRDSSFQVT